MTTGPAVLGGAHEHALVEDLAGRAEGSGGRTDAVEVQLLGRPALRRAADEGYRFRSRKTWALLAYLLLVERPPARTALAALLFADADDPLRALRWCLAEIRRGLGEGASVDGDPVVLRLPPDSTVDAHLVVGGDWADVADLPGLGSDLLDGIAVRGGERFDAWLLSARRHLAAACESVLHESALGSMARGELARAIGFAVRVTSMNPLEENHQALLIRLYRLAGDDLAADRQYRACRTLFERELGTPPGPTVQAALRTRRPSPVTAVADPDTVDAMLEAGAAAVCAGAMETGVRGLHAAVAMSDNLSGADGRVRSRLALAEALIHSLGGYDEEGLAALHEADEIARTAGLDDAIAKVRSELGYVDFLRARYDRAERWLRDVVVRAPESATIMAKTLNYLGSVHSDRGEFGIAVDTLEQAVEAARAAGAPSAEMYGLSMLGRVGLLTGDVERGETALVRAMRLAEQDRCLSLLPWPQALYGELQLACGDLDGAERTLRQAFARACLLGDPCWEGMAGRGLALVADAEGRTSDAFETLADARVRGSRLADAYVWLDAYVLEAQCALGRRHGHPDTEIWSAQLFDLMSRTGISGFGGPTAVGDMRAADATGPAGDRSRRARSAPGRPSVSAGRYPGRRSER